jgi:methyl-CpG-binding domain protein 4
MDLSYTYLSCMFPATLQVRSVLWQLLQLCPTPEAAAAADAAAIRAIITPLGLHNKRATAVQRLSHDFVHKQVGILWYVATYMIV